jgi:hypothetical protein
MLLSVKYRLPVPRFALGWTVTISTSEQRSRSRIATGEIGCSGWLVVLHISGSEFHRKQVETLREIHSLDSPL